MCDRRTESRWQQATGDAIAGEPTGGQPKPLPAPTFSRADFRSAHPDAEVLSRETGYHRSYGDNPYAGYDDVDPSPFPSDGPGTPKDLPPMARVVTVNTKEERVAYPPKSPAINDVVVDGEPLAVLWQEGTASAPDEDSIDARRDVGSAGVFSRRLDGRMLAFRSEGGGIFDEETSSERPRRSRGRGAGRKAAGTRREHGPLLVLPGGLPSRNANPRTPGYEVRG